MEQRTDVSETFGPEAMGTEGPVAWRAAGAAAATEAGSQHRGSTTVLPREAALQAFVEHMDADAARWISQSPSRERILEAFLRLASTHGVDSVSMRTIAKAVNIKAPSIYAHFPDGKDEILAESMRWHFYRFGVALMEALEPTRTSAEFWDAMVRLHFSRQVTLAESNLWDLVVATDRMAHILPARVSAQVTYWLGLYEALYEAAAAEMGFVDIDERIRMVMAFLEGATRWYTGPRDDQALRRAADRAVAMSHAVMFSRL